MWLLKRLYLPEKFILIQETQILQVGPIKDCNTLLGKIDLQIQLQREVRKAIIQIQ